MVNYSNNISKTNARLWKEGLNSDGQLFHQYQQNRHSPLTSNNWTQKDHNINFLLTCLDFSACENKPFLMMLTENLQG
jgi:hypothetical protein